MYAGRQTAKPSAIAETPDGFAFVPLTCRVLGQHRAGCRTGGEVVDDLHLRPHRVGSGQRGRPSPTKKEYRLLGRAAVT